MRRATARMYTAEEKRKAMERAIAVGPALSSEETGIPKGTLSFWTFAARQDKASTQQAHPTSAAKAASTGEGSLEEAPSTKRARIAKVYTPSEVARALDRVTTVGVRPAEAEREFNSHRGASATHGSLARSRRRSGEEKSRTAASRTRPFERWD